MKYVCAHTSTRNFSRENNSSQVENGTNPNPPNKSELIWRNKLICLCFCIVTFDLIALLAYFLSIAINGSISIEISNIINSYYPIRYYISLSILDMVRAGRNVVSVQGQFQDPFQTTDTNLTTSAVVTSGYVSEGYCTNSQYQPTTPGEYVVDYKIGK